MDTIAILQQKRLLRVDEAARILNVSRWTVYRWVDAGRLGGTRLGAGSLRIFSDTVVALIQSHSVGIAADMGESGRPSAAEPIAMPQKSGRGGVQPRPHAAL